MRLFFILRFLGRRRRATEDRLRVLAVRNDVFERAFLIVLVLLRLVDHEQVKPFAEAALARPRAELDLSAVFQLDVFLAEGAIARRDRDIRFGQKVQQAFPCRMRRRGSVRRVQDMFAALHDPVKLPHGNDFVLAVSTRDGIAELRMCPKPVGVFGQKVVQKKLLPLLRRASRGIVKLDRLRTARLLIGQHKRRRRRLAADARFGGHKSHLFLLLKRHCLSFKRLSAFDDYPSTDRI